MGKKQIIRLGLVILIAGIMTLGYGGWCKDDDDDVVATGSSAPPPPPPPTSFPQPPNGGTNVSINTQLLWQSVNGATSYDIYFGTTYPPFFVTNTPNTNYNPGTLSYSITYYWRIDALTASGTNTGQVWSFTTQASPVGPPIQVTNPDPANGSTNISINAQLFWSSSVGALSYDVYFGPTNPPSYVTNVPGTNYAPSVLSYNTPYYWRINARNSYGVTEGQVWSFTTQLPGAPDQVTSPNPTNGATDIPISQQLGWGAATGATSYDVYFGTSSPGTFKGNQAGTSYNPGTLSNNKTYYWRIDSVNAGGTTTSAVWSFTTIQNTFNYTGGQQQCVVPAGVTSIQVDVRGARGGGNAGFGGGGNGARVQTTLAVTPGQTLYIYVGGHGGNSYNGGYNGGGNGGDGAGFGKAGGGASDIRQGGTALNNRVVIAGGGGGNGGSFNGINGDGGIGGYNGGDGGNGYSGVIQTSDGGGGGTQNAGGSGSTGTYNGSSGVIGVGGNGGDYSGNGGGGGGGGGYYGGGGGDGCGLGAGGGGGGSSYSAGTGTTYTDGFETEFGVGQIIITW